VPGLTLRVGRRVSAWSLMVWVAGEEGVTKRGLKKKDERSRISLLEASATAGGLTVHVYPRIGDKLPDLLTRETMRCRIAASELAPDVSRRFESLSQHISLRNDPFLEVAPILSLVPRSVEIIGRIPTQLMRLTG
jgi:hypothetical protein